MKRISYIKYIHVFIVDTFQQTDLVLSVIVTI